MAGPVGLVAGAKIGGVAGAVGGGVVGKYIVASPLGLVTGANIQPVYYKIVNPLKWNCEKLSF